MSTHSFSVFFALLALATWIGTLGAIVVLVAHWRAPESGLARLFDDLAPAALGIAALVAVVTTLGSLYYSKIAHFTPCELCWYQRICMYPLSLILTIAAVRRDRAIWRYVVPLAAIGSCFAIYHTQLQAFPDQHSSFCTTVEPCTIRYVWEFGFVSLPFMALSAFSIIIVLMLVARANEREHEQADELAGA